METIRRWKGVLMIGIWVLALTATITASMEDDEKECADEMAELAACIPYVSGAAKQPTKECCDDTSKVRSAKPKCLCVLIKASTDPSVGLPINTTLALQMPAACNIHAKVSDCPTLLNLPADSPAAKIFKVASEDTSSGSTTTFPSSSSSSSSTSPTATASDNAKSTNLSANSGAKSATCNIIILMGLASVFLFFF